MYLKKIFILLLSLFMVKGFGGKLQRSKRYLIFPRQAPTRHQFIGGIGIPADLAYESLTIGYVLKAEFWLPWNATVYRENPYFPEYRRLKKRAIFSKTTTLRWDIYKLIIDRLNSYGYKGQECMFKAICEANYVPFNKEYNVFSELMHILFSPSSSVDMETSDCHNFKEAERMSWHPSSCSLYDCSLSLLDLISQVLHDF